MNLAKLRKFTLKHNKSHPWSRLSSDQKYIYATDGNIIVRTWHKPNRIKKKPEGGINTTDIWYGNRDLYIRPILIHNDKTLPHVIEIIPDVTLNPKYIRLFATIKDIVIAPASDFACIYFASKTEKCDGILAACIDPNKLR